MTLSRSAGMRRVLPGMFVILAALVGAVSASWFSGCAGDHRPAAFGCVGLLGRPLRVGIVTWPGYAAGIVANSGFRPTQNSAFYKGHNLCVEFMLMEDVDARAKAFARGGADGVDIVWSTVDFWANELPGFLKSGVRARAIMQVDWSRGGDAIIVDDGIRRIEDLYRKRVSLALFTPSHWLLEYSLQNSRLDESQQSQIVNALVGKNASPDARADFVAGKVDAAVVWEPDVTEALRRPNSHVLVSTQQARKLIADVMVAREDFIHDHPDVVEAFVAGWLVDGAALANRDADTVVRLLMENEPLYRNLGAEATHASLAKVRWADLGDNVEMFNLDGKDPQPLFDRIFSKASDSWTIRGYIGAPADPTAARDESFLRRLYQSRPVARIPDLLPPAPPSIATKPPSSSKSIAVNFSVNSYELDQAARQEVDKISLLPTAFSGGAYIRVEGNTDGTGNPSSNRQLSERRARSVVAYLIAKYHLHEEQFVAVGYGPDRPVASNLTEAGRSENRRTQISIVLR